MSFQTNSMQVDKETENHASRLETLKTTLKMNILAITMFYLAVPESIISIINMNCENKKGQCEDFLEAINYVSYVQLVTSFIHPIFALFMLFKNKI